MFKIVSYFYSDFQHFTVFKMVVIKYRIRNNGQLSPSALQTLENMAVGQILKMVKTISFVEQTANFDIRAITGKGYFSRRGVGETWAKRLSDEGEILPFREMHVLYAKFPRKYNYILALTICV